MKGESTGVQNSDWVAVLTLKPDGTLGWRETEGATPGATRTGTWDYDGTTIILRWAAPKGGQTAWVSTSVKGSSIEQGAYTAENSPSGVWSASKSGGTSQRSRLQGRLEDGGENHRSAEQRLGGYIDPQLGWNPGLAGDSRCYSWSQQDRNLGLRWYHYNPQVDDADSPDHLDLCLCN